MGRSRKRPPKPPEYGIARGWRQRGILRALLAGETIGVQTHPGAQSPGPPGGITFSAWAAFQERLTRKGYRIVWEREHFGRWRYQLIGADDWGQTS